MRCPNCQADTIKESANFCPKCGHNFTEEPGTNLPTAPALPNISLHISRNVKIAAGVIAAVVCAVLLVSFIFKPAAPEDVAGDFIKALKSGDYDKAFKYLDDTEFIGRPLLNEENFGLASREKFKAITEYRLDISSLDPDDYTTQTFNTVFGLGGERGKLKLVLVNRGTRNKPDWKIDPSVFLKVTTIQTLKDVSVTVNGVPVTVASGAARLDTFDGCPLKISFTHPNISPVEKEAKSGDAVRHTTPVVSDSVKSSAQELVKGYLNGLQEAVKNTDIKPVAQYLKPDSSGWNNVKRGLDYNSQGGVYSLMEVKNVSFGEIILNGDVKKVKARYTWAGREETKKLGEEPVFTSDDTVQRSFTAEIEQQSDGRWLIVRAE
ncbi:MAG: zinc ribbon domain-containing protein [Firmicutes bacterium]|nr:zinc ribbon domain-containing protein [Bacillota bacterium]